MELNTQRLLLRQIKTTDLDDIFEYSKNPNVGPNAGWKPHESKEETLDVMESIFMNQDTVWGIVLKETDKLIGSIGLIDDPKREYDNVRMIGYAIGELYWGKGFMTEAMHEVVKYGFENLKLDLISAYCYPFNAKSKRVLTKCNFEYEGTLKMAEELYDGNLYDKDCYCLTMEQYNKL